ncbi:MAG: 50S ribosomal protein L11 methyltransferase [Candidatus Aenigmarchaeota archaeon]|nr:50S ribosomal protein L11 methyltransferase [Candidatus Aenigmarchaeota archaeon]
MRSFTVIGAVAVIDAGPAREERALVKDILRTHPQIKTIMKKTSPRKGTYRRHALTILYKRKTDDGLRQTETIHKEFGCAYLLDVAKAFFNPRESRIRSEIADEVRDGEQVLVMFCGVGPYPVLIAKRRRCLVTGIELNPTAAAYAEENVRKNKVQERVRIIRGDVRKAEGTYDRIVMPLATEAYRYFPLALRHIRKGGIIHLYGLAREGSRETEDVIAAAADEARKKVRIISVRRGVPYSPRVTTAYYDVKVE